MTRQLATMITSGMTLLRAFYVLEDQIENKLLRETVGAVREDIESGLAFSDALAKHPKIFSPLYVAMVRAGETGGVLEASLDRISDQLEKDDQLRRQVKGAMAYPIVVLSFALMVLIGLIAFIVPVFVNVFEDFGGELPLITKFTVQASHVVTHQWYILIALAIGGPIALQEVAHLQERPPAVGPDPPEVPVQDRSGGPEDLAGPLVAHVRRRCTRPACRSCRRSRSRARPPATPSSRRRWPTSSSPSSPAARSPTR